MSVEHWIALVASIPSVEGVVGQYQPNSITNVLLLVVLDFDELISEFVVVQELIVVVSQYQVLLTLKVLQQVYCGLGVVARHVAQDEHMVVWLYYCVPVLGHSVVVVLRAIQLVVGEGQIVRRPPNGICVCLVAKVYVRYVEVVCHLMLLS